MKIRGYLVDIHLREIYPAEVTVMDGRIKSIQRAINVPEVYILPGLTDAHIHIESSMITPGSFAIEAVKKGTTAVVSDPHEIANVLGRAGINFMIEDASRVPLRFYFGAPSCVPATKFETNGGELNSEEIKDIIKMPDIHYLAEMMNFPGVIFRDKEVMSKLEAAKKLGKPVDGHAPGLSGKDLWSYIAAGISTDHECVSYEEAVEKVSLGMKILIREGSAATNLDSLKKLFETNPEKIMLCSDDLHPEMLRVRHIDKLIAKLISEGFDPFDVIRSATINPVLHYNLEAGLLMEGQNADFILVDSLSKMNVLETWIDGNKVYDRGKVLFTYNPAKGINNFNCTPVEEKDIKVINNNRKIRVIEAFDGELITKEKEADPGTNRFIESDIKNDILKIVVKDRYNDSPPVTGFIMGFGLKKGAFASSVAHDSHNIISVGTNDSDIVSCINEIVRQKGGLSVSQGEMSESLQLNIGGIMTTHSCEEVANDYEMLTGKVKALGCRMAAPFMTLSFMALLVIPDLKIGDKGLFDVKKFELVQLHIG